MTRSCVHPSLLGEDVPEKKKPPERFTLNSLKNESRASAPHA